MEEPQLGYHNTQKKTIPIIKTRNKLHLRYHNPKEPKSQITIKKYYNVSVIVAHCTHIHIMLLWYTCTTVSALE